MIVGQILYYVPENRNGGQPRELTVSSVGRKWAALTSDTGSPGGFGRCDKKTGWVDGRGFSSPGRCWPSHTAWETHRDVSALWQQLRAKFTMASRDAPPGVTRLDILAAAELLKL